MLGELGDLLQDVLHCGRRGTVRQHLAKESLDLARHQMRSGEGAQLLDIGGHRAVDHATPDVQRHHSLPATVGLEKYGKCRVVA